MEVGEVRRREEGVYLNVSSVLGLFLEAFSFHFILLGPTKIMYYSPQLIFLNLGAQK